MNTRERGEPGKSNYRHYINELREALNQFHRQLLVYQSSRNGTSNIPVWLLTAFQAERDAQAWLRKLENFGEQAVTIEEMARELEIKL